MKPMKNKIEDLEVGDKIHNSNGMFIEILDIDNNIYKVIDYDPTWRYDKVNRYLGEPYFLNREEIIMGLNYNNPKTFYVERYLIGRNEYFDDPVSNTCKEIISLKQKEKMIDLLTKEKINKIYDSYGEADKHLISHYTLFNKKEINMLNKSGIVYMEQLLNLTINELQHVKGIGNKSLEHIIFELRVVD